MTVRKAGEKAQWLVFISQTWGQKLRSINQTHKCWLGVASSLNATECRDTITSESWLPRILYLEVLGLSQRKCGKVTEHTTGHQPQACTWTSNEGHSLPLLATLHICKTRIHTCTPQTWENNTKAVSKVILISVVLRQYLTRSASNSWSSCLSLLRLSAEVKGVYHMTSSAMSLFNHDSN